MNVMESMPCLVSPQSIVPSDVKDMISRDCRHAIITEKRIYGRRIKSQDKKNPDDYILGSESV